MEPDKQKSELVVLGAQIADDGDARYRLVDLHKASGKLEKHKPVQFMRLQSTQDLINELRAEKVGNPTLSPDPINTKKGRGGGIHVCRELVYTYAMWISAKFHLKVIRSFDAIVAQNSDEQLSATDKVLRAEKALDNEVLGVSQAASKLAKSKRTVPPLRTAFVEAAHGLQLCFPGLDVTPLLEAAKPKLKRARR
ncbi:KilA-N domain-containing protein [Pararobbsia alpina]|uniref:KilA-N domain-containing protein n=1 Tax=Pararobbsia alpina TaxID=621374 RepID=A0A6S7B9B3_9BURK|nr:KilA-N domain-containing protein [Pararobbsia alpina]CAB3783438.1 hypothetical protein LMG28138_01640 [Pararobbsia alpina]